MLVAAGLFLIAAVPATAQVEGPSYTIQPQLSRVYWDGNAGLDNGLLYGGALGFGFGQYLEVSGVYVRGDNFETNFSDFSGGIFAEEAFENVADRDAALEALGALATRNVDIRRIGAKLRLNLAGGNFVPFVTAGTGVLRFEPDGLSDSEQIYATAGLGLTFSLADRYTLTLAGEGLAYRFAPGTLLLSDSDLEQVGIGGDAFDQQTVFNPALTAGLTFFLGGRSPGQMTALDRAMINQFGGGGFKLAVEPFYGRIDFNDALNLGGNQTVGGIEAGLDFGPQVGMRAFYWRGLDDEDATDTDLPDGFQDLSMFGAELNLHLSDRVTRSLAPYLILGGGYLSTEARVNLNDRETTGDRFFGIGGVGLEVPLTDAFALQGSVRSLLMSSEDIEDVARSNSVHNSWMYTLGLNFNLGGGGRTPGQLIGDRFTAGQDRDEALSEEVQRLQARIDSLDYAWTQQQRERRLDASADRDTLVLTADRPDALDRSMDRQDIDRRERGSNISDRTVTLPVPENGEFYVRFGDAVEQTTQQTSQPVYGPPLLLGTGGLTTQADARTYRVDTTWNNSLTPAQIREAVRQAVAEQQRDALTARVLEDRLRDMESRLEQRIDRQSDRLGNEIDALEARDRSDLRDRLETRDLPDARGVRPPEEATVDDTPEDTDDGNGLIAMYRGRDLVHVMPIVGYRLGDGPSQFLVGARSDYRFPRTSFRFMPEATIGLGEDTSFNLIANGVAPLGYYVANAVQPYAGAGLGLISDNGFSGLDMVFNLLAGAEYQFNNGLAVFVEYNTQDLFDVNRILVGSRFQF